MNQKQTIHGGFTPQLIGDCNSIITRDDRVHDLGQTPEWCGRWAEAYPESWSRLAVVQSPESVYPLMIRKKAGLNVLVWIGQGDGMMSDYSGGIGSYRGLLNALIDLDGWDVADLQLPHWNRENGILLKALLRYEKFLWRVDVSEQSVVIDLPPTFEQWLASLARTPRTHARRYVRNIDEGAGRFEILTGPDILPALDELIANNQKTWDVLRREKDSGFFRQAVNDLINNPHLFLARLSDDSVCWAACLGYRCGDSVFIHTAGIRREVFRGMAPGVVLYSLLIREMINQKMRVFDFSPGLEEYKFRLGGRWAPGHRLLFARSRRGYCQYRIAESVNGFCRSCRELAGRIHLAGDRR